MRVLRMLGMVLAVLALAVPASAATTDEPDLIDSCGGTVKPEGQRVYAVHESIDLCRGWIETLSAHDEVPELRFTVETAAPIEDRLPSFLSVTWRAADCGFRLVLDDSTNEGETGLHAACGEEPAPTCPVPGVDAGCQPAREDVYELPDGGIVVDGNRLQFTVRFEGEIAQFAALHMHGSVLSYVDALSSGVVGPMYGWVFGCTAGLGQYDRCSEINGDWMHSVEETYTVGT